MGSGVDAYDNAMLRQLRCTLQCDLADRPKFPDQQAAHACAIFQSHRTGSGTIGTVRAHSALGYQSHPATMSASGHMDRLEFCKSPLSTAGGRRWPKCELHRTASSRSSTIDRMRPAPTVPTFMRLQSSGAAATQSGGSRSRSHRLATRSRSGDVVVPHQTA